jgi:hypothetical protein
MKPARTTLSQPDGFKKQDAQLTVNQQLDSIRPKRRTPGRNRGRSRAERRASSIELLKASPRHSAEREELSLHRALIERPDAVSIAIWAHPRALAVF